MSGIWGPACSFQFRESDIDRHVQYSKWHNGISYGCIYVDYTVISSQKCRTSLLNKFLEIYLAENLLTSAQEPFHILNRHPKRILTARNIPVGNL